MHELFIVLFRIGQGQFRRVDVVQCEAVDFVLCGVVLGHLRKAGFPLLVDGFAAFFQGGVFLFADLFVQG